MPAGLIGAVALHAAIIIAVLFTWQHRLDIVDESPPVVPVDLVTIAPKTNIAPTIRPEPRAEPQPAVQPQSQPLVTPPLPKVREQSEVAPPDQAPAPAVKPPPPIVPKVKPQAQPDQKKTAFNPDNVLALLNKIAPNKQPQANGRVSTSAHLGVGAETAMTMDLVDALRNQIEQCWNPPAGAPHPEQLVVYIDLTLNPDGNVARPPQLAAQSASAVAGNPFARAAADAAMRAIYVCAPFKLPPDRYADWRDSTIKFDPRDLVGQ